MGSELMRNYVPVGWKAAPYDLNDRPSPEELKRAQEEAAYRVGLKRKLRLAGIVLPWDTETQTLEALCAWLDS